MKIEVNIKQRFFFHSLFCSCLPVVPTIVEDEYIQVFIDVYHICIKEPLTFIQDRYTNI